MLGRGDHTDIGGHGAAFPTTQWTALAQLGRIGDAQRQAILSQLVERYWKPAYHFLRRRGCDNEEAKDTVQEFFTVWLDHALFERADPEKGRFRSFLLTCLKNFASNRRRRDRAEKRRPAQGFVSVRELSGTDTAGAVEPVDTETPEDAFNRAWAMEVLTKALRQFEKDCLATGKEVHLAIFRRRIVEPAFEGKAPTPERELASELGLTPKEVANRLLTARRAFRKALEREVSLYAASAEDLALEMRDLFGAFASG